MKKYIIFDNGGRTPDRYTIINKETGDVFSAGDGLHDVNGTGKFCGNCAEHRIVMYGAGWRQRSPGKKMVQTETENYINNARLNPDWLGLEVGLMSLPENVRSYIETLHPGADSGHHLKAVVGL